MLDDIARDEAAGQADEPVSIYLNVVSQMGRGVAMRSVATTTLIFRRTRPRFGPGFWANRHKVLAKYLKGWWA
ncbi:hypothetical protein [Mesorhizobium sp. 113-3-9]|uniref:hypothetical protein n=1 Tax=Mesorhizobium sp. 113-3-9 TaxID=2744517 RepID=UPI001926B133|nr:hypothetical protein [Mesorhizobium sp. 113-3-9]